MIFRVTLFSLSVDMFKACNHHVSGIAQHLAAISKICPRLFFVLFEQRSLFCNGSPAATYQHLNFIPA